MPRAHKILLLVTDVGFILYWAITALVACGLLAVPPEWLFKDYHNPDIVAWNWSFMPLDLLASLSGLIAVRRALRRQAWRNAALVSMTLTFCAGFMALSFWVVQGSFDVTWWVPNLFLMLWPPFMASKLRS
jgi:Family of unknown function (DUF5360)